MMLESRLNTHYSTIQIKDVATGEMVPLSQLEKEQEAAKVKLQNMNRNDASTGALFSQASSLPFHSLPISSHARQSATHHQTKPSFLATVPVPVVLTMCAPKTAVRRAHVREARAQGLPG